MRKTKGTEGLEAGEWDHILVKRFALRVVGGPNEGVLHSAKTDRVTIGTHRSSDLVLSDPTMSRFHCEIRLLEGKPTLRDLGSRNGTEIEGVSIESAHLRDGQTLKLGRTHVRFEIGSEASEIELSPRERFGLLVGRSEAMRATFALLERAAQSDATVLLQGETGTGKELAAESLHEAGKRKGRPFVIIDCGAIASSLLESELFGHERGAFTGAETVRPGAFERAAGGTLFLDEVGEIELPLQPKFLRAIENGEVQRIGSAKRRRADVRVIAATNRSLRAEVNAKRFRSDLYYRLAVVNITLPPLRERFEDLPLLVEELVSRFSAREADSILEEMRTREFLARLKRYAWPGNVRELRNYLERCLALADHPPPDSASVRTDDLSVDIRQPFHAARRRWLSYFERRYLQALLSCHGHNISEVARAAGIDRRNLYRILSRCGLE